MVNYILQSKSVPTLVIYQKRTLVKPVNSLTDLNKPLALLADDQIDLLYCQAKEADEVDSQLYNDEELQKQQIELMRQIEIEA